MNAFLFSHHIFIAMRVTSARFWHIDIDRLLNPLIPPNSIHRLPRPISRFLGYRRTPQHEIGNLLVAFWACMGAFLGVIMLEAVFMIPEIRQHGPPLIIASFVRRRTLSYLLYRTYCAVRPTSKANQDNKHRVQQPSSNTTPSNPPSLNLGTASSVT